MRGWRKAVLVLALPFAYAMGWLADAMLNDDPCLNFMVETGPQVDFDDELWPARTNCVVAGRRVETGDPTVFYAVFGFWLVVAGLLLARMRWRVRIAGAVIAWVVSVYVIFA